MVRKSNQSRFNQRRMIMAKTTEVVEVATPTELTIVRPFDHKTFGRIGTVTLSAGVNDMSLNGTVLPASSIEYLLTFALQNLQDAYAGAESAVEAVARWEKKLDRLLAGTIGTREAGDGASATVRMIRTVLRELVRKSDKWAAFKELGESEQNEKLDALYAKQSDASAIDAEVAKRIAALAEKAKQAKALAAMVDIDI
jgi:hypothetical protein